MELFDSLTVAQNVALGREAGIAGSSLTGQLFSRRSERVLVGEAARSAIELCGLDELVDRRVASLSTGQRRLVELARVVAGDFRVLLLDEPSSGLDHAETRRFAEILRAVIARGQTGILLVEHDMSLVMDVCQYVYVIDFGKLIYEGEPDAVMASDEVRAAYLGAEVA
jgi:ABC-type branched-subunit amino acid transport system ATPase component